MPFPLLAPAVPPTVRRGCVLVTLIGVLAAAHRTSAEPPPWTVESPGGAGASVAVGLDGLYDDVDRLTIDSAKTTVTLRDPDGGVSVQRVDGDPALLNRKFRVGWTAKGVGAQVPVKLPSFHLGGALSVYPFLDLQAAFAETTLTTHDIPEPAESTSLTARGLLVGGTLGAVVPLCRRCGRFAVAGYRYRLLPDPSVTGSTPPGSPNLRVTRDDLRLRQSASDLFLRLGSTYADGRLAASLGIVSRCMRIDVHDKLGFSSALGEETSVNTRTRYVRRATGAIANLDAHLAGPFYFRAEAILAGSDRSALLKVAYLLERPSSGPPGGAPPSQIGDRPGAGQGSERSVEEVAAAIAGPLRDILAEYRARAAELAKADPPYPLAGVTVLFDDTERKLIDALAGNELAALRDFVHDLFSRARADLGLERSAGSSHPRAVALVAARAPASVALAVQEPRREPQRAASVVAWVDAAIALLSKLVETRDLRVDLCIQSTPEPRARFSMHPKSYPQPMGVNTNHSLVHVWRGLYVYAVERQGFKPIAGDLDLVRDVRPILRCQLVPDSASASALPCDQERGKVNEECPQ